MTPGAHPRAFSRGGSARCVRHGAVVIGVVVGALVVGGGADVEGAGGFPLPALGIGGDGCDCPCPGPGPDCPASPLGAGAGTGDFGEAAFASGAPEAPGAPDVGVVFGRGFDALSASRMRKVTPAKPSTNAEMHAPTMAARRLRVSRRAASSFPSLLSTGGVGSSGTTSTEVSRTVAGETGT
jgi:hypothetical protein